MNTTWSDSTRSWPAIAYQNKLPGGKADGRLAIEGQDLVFSAGGVPPLRLSIDRTDIRYGGFNNQQAFLSHPDLPDWTFLCADPGFIKDDAIRKHPVHGKLANRTVRASKRWPWPVKAMILLTMMFITGVVALWTFRENITGWVANKIPLSAEKQVGDLLFQEMKGEWKMSEDPELKAKLDAVTTRLLPAINDLPYELTFHLVEDETINAYALPGGHVIVLTGLLKATKRPEEAAGVLAHEIAHITRRHHIRRLISQVGWTAFVRTLYGDYTGLAGDPTVLLTNKGSRDHEREADARGWEYLLAANVDPRGMTDFFKTLMAMENKGLSMPLNGHLNLLSTHPETPERVATLEEKWKAVPKDRKFDPILPVVAPAIPPPTATSPPAPATP